MAVEETESDAITAGIRVSAVSEYQPAHSSPGRYVFAYRIRILNESRDDTVQLRSRHWIIVDQMGKREDVHGPGVVGEEPTLARGEGFAYTSGAILETPRGTMEGSYTFDGPDGPFDVTIAPFALAVPFSLN